MSQDGREIKNNNNSSSSSSKNNNNAVLILAFCGDSVQKPKPWNLEPKHQKGLKQNQSWTETDIDWEGLKCQENTRISNPEAHGALRKKSYIIVNENTSQV